MNKRIFLIFIFAFLLVVPFISAVPPPSTQIVLNLDAGLQIEVPKIGTIKQEEDFLFSIHVYNITSGLRINNESTNCSLEIYNKNGTELINNDNLEFKSSDWIFLAKGGNFTRVGEYFYIIDCESESEGGVLSIPFDVTYNGRERSYSYLIAMFFLILVFIGFGFLIYKDKERIDDEKYFNRLVSKWKDKNYLKFSATALWYNMRKNSYIFHYLIGLAIMMMVYDLTLVYNLTSISPVFSVLVSLYTWGSAIVTLVFFGSVQEWIMEWKEEIENINWGMSDVK